jgi:hypothetical protein
MDEQSGHHNEKASRAASGRRPEIDPDLMIFLVMASSPKF